MDDLSKWDYATEFRLYEAAALIVGIDPAKIYTETKPAHYNPRIFDYHEHPEIKPVVDRMKFSFHEAADLYYAMHKGHWHHDEDEPSPELVLRSREMETIPLEICSKLLPLNPTTQSVLDTWMASGDTANYETCKFARAELSRWLSVNRLASVYPFAKNATSQSQERNGSRPVEKSLSKRERTSLLNIVGAMLAQLTAGKDNDTTVITQAVIDFGTKDGISERKLQQVFAEAKRSLGAS